MAGDERRFQQAMNQGHSAAWEQEWSDAATYYRKAVEEMPTNPMALTSLGLALFELQDYEGALRCYGQAAEAAPSDPVPFEKVSELLEQLGKPEQAADSSLRAAELHLKTQDVNKAIESWSNAIRLKPDHIVAHTRLAMVFERMGRKQQAVTEYLAIAGLLQYGGEIPKAVQTVTHALKVLPESKEAAQALQMLQTGQRLPRPGKPLGRTGPLPPRGTPPVATPKELPSSTPVSTGQNPILEARQRALSALASMLFDEADEDQEAQTTRRGLQAIVHGALSGLQQVDQTKITLHLTQAVDLQSRGEGAKALDDMERAVDAGLDHAAAYFDLGYLLTEALRLESAARHLQRAVRHEEFALGARLLLGEVYRKMKRLKEASIEFLEALRIADAQCVPPENAEALSQLYDPVIEELSQRNDVDAEARLCENVTSILVQPDWRERIKNARLQMPAQSEGNPLVPLAEFIAEASGGELVESVSRIHQLARAGKVRAAMEEAFHAIQFAPTYLPLHSTMGDLLVQEGRTQEAINKFSAVARSYNIRGEAMRSINILRRIIELAPMDMQARNQLIETLVARGSVSDALNEYVKLADIYYSLADLATVRKTYGQALHLAQQSNADRNWKVNILHRMADIELQSLDWRQALRGYEQIRSLKPDDEKARTSLVELNFRLNQEKQALAELDGYLTHLLGSKQYERALTYVESLIGDRPKQAALRRRMGELYRQAGKIQEAIEQLDAAGELALEAGDRNTAAEAIMAILALNPSNAIDYQKLLAQIRAG